VGALLSALLPREFFLRAGLLRVMIQRVASGSAAVAREFFAARGAACFAARCRVQCRRCVRECCLQLNGEKGAQQSAQAAPGAVPCFLFSCTREGILERNFPIVFVLMH